MKFSLDIACSSPAFMLDVKPEIARILRHVADRVECGEVFNWRNVVDFEGNTIGRFRLGEG